VDYPARAAIEQALLIDRAGDVDGTRGGVDAVVEGLVQAHPLAELARHDRHAERAVDVVAERQARLGVGRGRGGGGDVGQALANRIDTHS
jgi:predicted alpha-1,6-mannanase (GH76 family)